MHIVLSYTLLCLSTSSSVIIFAAVGAIMPKHTHTHTHTHTRTHAHAHTHTHTHTRTRTHTPEGSVQVVIIEQRWSEPNHHRICCPIRTLNATHLHALKVLHCSILEEQKWAELLSLNQLSGWTARTYIHAVSETKQSFLKYCYHSLLQ